MSDITTFTGADLYAIWSPEESPWAAYAKPALFVEFGQWVDMSGTKAHLTKLAGELRPGLERLRGQPIALIVDCPGAMAVQGGLALAAHGFQPVPLFNGLHGRKPVVDVQPIQDALVAGAAQLRLWKVPPDAPPAFLLDSRRMEGRARPGEFDNRWMVFPQDFPSARFLLERGIRRALVLQENSLGVRDDLSHVLLRWQEAGIAIEVALLHDMADSRRPIDITRPRAFRSLWHRFLAMFGFRRDRIAGFGSYLPEEQVHTGGGYYAGGGYRSGGFG